MPFRGTASGNFLPVRLPGTRRLPSADKDRNQPDAGLPYLADGKPRQGDPSTRNGPRGPDDRRRPFTGWWKLHARGRRAVVHVPLSDRKDGEGYVLRWLRPIDDVRNH